MLPVGQYTLSKDAFRTIADILYREAGIVLADHKSPLVISRLSRRLRQLGLSSFEQYIERVNQSGSGSTEMTNLVNALTTNKTDFFREAHHFEFLTKLARQMTSKSRSGALRLWCSASSTGEEPYTLAMVLHDHFKDHTGWDVRILASDIDTNVLSHASAGVYRDDLVEPIPERYKRRYFTQQGTQWKVSPELRKMIVYRKINLIYDEFRFSSPVDIIFCRNVLIYFDRPGKEEILAKFKKILAKGGHIFVGHSESLLGAGERSNLKCVAATVYQDTRA